MAYGVRKEIFAYGLRNPWRYSWDRQDRRVMGRRRRPGFVGGSGPGHQGGNYGWSVREGAHHFKPGPAGAQYIEPVMEYPHRPNLQPKGCFPTTASACA